MKRIELKTLEAPNSPPISYSDVLVEVIRRPLNPREGIAIDEMRKSIRLLDALESANGMLELEDADHQYLKQKLDAMGWNLADRRILQLVDDVTNA